MAEASKWKKQAMKTMEEKTSNKTWDEAKETWDEAKGNWGGGKAIPAKFKSIVDEVSKMSVLDLSELVKVLEDHFGVSAAVPMAMAAAPAGSGEAAAVEEKTSFAVHLTAGGDQKIQVIKVLREVTSLGLKEAKDIVDGAPKLVKDGVSKADAEEIKKKIEAVGGKVEIK